MVFTSTCGAVYYGHPLRAKPFDETSWTNVEAGGMSAYVKSKALAERAAWDFMKREGGSLELTTVNPTGIFGPALSTDYSESLELIKRLIDGGMPACPDLMFNQQLKDLSPLLGKVRNASGAKAIRVLGWKPRAWEDAVTDTAKSLIDLGVVKI